MLFTIILFIIVILCLFICILFKPSISIKNITVSTFWIPVLIGAVLLLCFQKISFVEAFNSLTNTSRINPLKILILFFSMTAISTYLDEVHFFEYLANRIVKKANGSQLRLFFLLYILISILTVFTSNDIIILTFTPFISYFAKAAKIDPIPYLVMEFVAANTWSMFLIIGNPTNIYLATSFNIDFVEYFSHMAIPTICSGTISFALLILLFWKKLHKSFEKNEEILPFKVDWKYLIYGLIILGLTLIGLTISNIINVEMYLISLSLMIILFIGTLIIKKIKCDKNKAIISTLKRLPYQLIPFVLGMFMFVIGLDKYGVSTQCSNLLSGTGSLWKYGFGSLLFSNIINNIPTSVFLVSVLNQDAMLSTTSIYASIIGTNIGAFLTPFGALAGVMWLNLLHKAKIRFTFFDFIKYGMVIGIVTMSIALLSLFVVTSFC